MATSHGKPNVHPRQISHNFVWNTSTLAWDAETQPGGGGSGDGAILDGVSSSIKATVFDHTNSNPLAVQTVDSNGDPVSAGGTTQYAEDTASTVGEQVAMAGVVRKDTRGTLVDTDGDRTELQVNSSGDLRVDGSAVTQPISAASLPLPTGAATAALQTQPGVDIGDVTINNGAGVASVNIQDGGNSITVDGTITANQGGAPWSENLTQVGGSAVSLGQKVSASSIPVVIASDQTSIPVTKVDLTPSAPTTASIGTSSAQAVAAAATRKGLILRNTSTSGQRISFGFGSTAVLDSGVTLYPQDVYCMGEYDFDTGAVNAISSAASGSLAVQEYLT